MEIQVTLRVTVQEGSVFHLQGVPDPIIIVDGRLPKDKSMTDPITWIGAIERIKGTKIVQIQTIQGNGEARPHIG